MSEINDIDFEQDQQEVLEKTDIKTLSHYCLMLQKNNTEMINLNIQIDDLTDKLNAANAVEKKENENEESNIRTVQTEKPN